MVLPRGGRRQPANQQKTKKVKKGGAELKVKRSVNVCLFCSATRRKDNALFVDPSEIAKQVSPTSTPFSCCVGCYKFLNEQLPGVRMGEISQDPEFLDEVRGGIAAVREDEGNPARKTFTVGDAIRQEIEVEDSFDMPTMVGVKKKYHKTPRALGLKAFRYKPVGQKRRTVYPIKRTRKKHAESADGVRHQLAAECGDEGW